MPSTAALLFQSSPVPGSSQRNSLCRSGDRSSDQGPMAQGANPCSLRASEHAEDFTPLEHTFASEKLRQAGDLTIVRLASETERCPATATLRPGQPLSRYKVLSQSFSNSFGAVANAELALRFFQVTADRVLAKIQRFEQSLDCAPFETNRNTASSDPSSHLAS